MFYIDKNKNCLELEKFNFEFEDTLQEILYKEPQILLACEGLEISPYETIVSIREYSTNRGAIDLVYLTNNGDIILVETKLLKNPESHRKVVAQAIDYARAFTEESTSKIKTEIQKRKLSTEIFENDRLETILDKNIKSGNFQILIVGDDIHPNILGMVESIQSAPHLSFTISTISINSFKKDENIILYPKVEAKTLEVERSVISIEVINNQVKIDSSSPEKTSKGNKPKITAEEFLESIEDVQYLKSIKNFWDRVEKQGGTIDWGTVGFSGGYRFEGRRISLIWVYGTKINILTRRMKESHGIISDQLYNKYLEELKKSDFIYDNVVVPNKSEVDFKDISIDELEIVLDATIELMKELKESD